MTDDALRAIRERWAAATPGPWEHGRGYYDQGGTYLEMYRADDPTIEIFGEYREPNEADLEAIAAAPTDIAALLAEVERLRGEQAQSVRFVTDGSVAVQYGPYPVDPSVLNGFYAHLRALGFSEPDPDLPQ